MSSRKTSAPVMPSLSKYAIGDPHRGTRGQRRSVRADFLRQARHEGQQPEEWICQLN